MKVVLLSHLRFGSQQISMYLPLGTRLKEWRSELKATRFSHSQLVCSLESLLPMALLFFY